MSTVKVFHPRHSASPHNGLFASLGLARSSRPDDVVPAIRVGFSVSVLERLAEELMATQQTILAVTRIPPATLTRRRREGGRLTPQESDRVYRLASVLQDAVQLFEGDKEAARHWMNEPAKALGGNTPLEHLDTEAGADAVHDLIGRIGHGVVT